MAGGKGLKPVIKLICPVFPCDFEFKYHVKDSRMNPSDWVMTAASRDHLENHPVAKPKLHIVKSEELPEAA